MEQEFNNFFEELIKFSSIIYPESPRSAAIVGASQVDVELEKLIKKYFGHQKIKMMSFLKMIEDWEHFPQK